MASETPVQPAPTTQVPVKTVDEMLNDYHIANTATEEAQKKERIAKNNLIVFIKDEKEAIREIEKKMKVEVRKPTLGSRIKGLIIKED